MYPVIYYIINIVEYAAPANTWVATGVVCPEVTHEGGVLTADGRTKGVVPRVEGLRTDGVLDSHIDSWLLAVGLAVLHIEHVTVEGDVLVESPLTRAVVNHDITHGVASEGVLTIRHQRLATTEAHVADDDIMGVYLE